MYSVAEFMKDDTYPIWRDIDDHMDMPDGVEIN
jgi:hypothetical protein